MDVNGFDPHRYSPWTLLLVGSLTTILLMVSFFVEIRVLITSPNYGDVTGMVRTTLRVLLAVATFGSFCLGIYNLLADDGHSGGPVNTFEIKGDNHDIDLHLHALGTDERTVHHSRSRTDRDDASGIDDEEEENDVSNQPQVTDERGGAETTGETEEETD
jgi:hypothetical protein